MAEHPQEPTSGRFPAYPGELSPETRIPLGWAIALVGGAVGLAAVAGTAHFRLGAMEERQNAHEAASGGVHVDAAKQAQQHEIRIQRGEDNYARILETMGEMKADLKDLKGRRRRTEQ